MWIKLEGIARFYMFRVANQKVKPREKAQADGRSKKGPPKNSRLKDCGRLTEPACRKCHVVSNAQNDVR